jgi:hypothetical protein
VKEPQSRDKEAGMAPVFVQHCDETQQRLWLCGNCSWQKQDVNVDCFNHSLVKSSCEFWKVKKYLTLNVGYLLNCNTLNAGGGTECYSIYYLKVLDNFRKALYQIHISTCS